MKAQDRSEYRQYLEHCTDSQLQGCLDKESDARREDYVELVMDEANQRGITLVRVHPAD